MSWGQNHPWEYREMGDAKNKQTKTKQRNKKQGPLMTLTLTKQQKKRSCALVALQVKMVTPQSVETSSHTQGLLRLLGFGAVWETAT